VLDLNRQLVENKLAARIAFLYEDKEYNQEPTFEEERAMFKISPLICAIRRHSPLFR